MLKRRCAWATTPLGIAYHDKEWGVPVHDDRVLFEFLILEGAQAGLSWETILQKRENYRKAFARFDPKKISRFSGKKTLSLMRDAGIVRNRLKIESSVTNARAFLAVQKEFGSFDAYIWRFKDAKAMSKDLLKRGFRFVGPTICYAFMQAIGIVNDHAKDCFPAVKKKPKKHRYSVYVIELSPKVWNHRRFRKSNPDHDVLKPCVYVGMTGLSPDVRFDKHKAGIQANRFVELYGERLLPQLYEVFNPMPYDAARDMEVELAIALREKGYGVWQG